MPPNSNDSQTAAPATAPASPSNANAVPGSGLGVVETGEWTA
jgi:hypothetical protein